MRTATLKIRLSPSERAIIDERAGNMSAAAYLRQCAINRPPVQLPPINADAIRELNKIGVNLNQLVRLAHTTPPSQITSIRDLNARISETIDQIGNALPELTK